MNDLTEMATEMIRHTTDVMETAPDGVKEELVALQAKMDGFAAQLRNGGMSPGQIGALVMDGLILQGHPRQICIFIAMRCLR